MSKKISPKKLQVRFIGSAGIPNRYGGFESFLENCAPIIASMGNDVTVTCDARFYKSKAVTYKGVRRIFLKIPANGGLSIIHDFLAFIRVFRGASHIIVLGVSGGLWFPLFRLLCDLAGARLLVNVDGIEWRRTKFSKIKRLFLKVFDQMAQKFAHSVIYDNLSLYPYLISSAKSKAVCIPYSGDHVLRLEGVASIPRTALTICRIEPENNLEMLIEGVLKSNLKHYTIIGNWSHSTYAQKLHLRYKNEVQLSFLDSIYDPVQLAKIRESCELYLHGHSVGGTNPSLVEILFYDCRILCFDVSFNRETSGESAKYFKNVDLLVELIEENVELDLSVRNSFRSRYTSFSIVNQYLSLMLENSRAQSAPPES